MASQPAHNEIVHTSMGAGRWFSAIMYLGTCRSLVRTMFVLCACTYCLLECVCVFAHICANTNAQIYHLLVYDSLSDVGEIRVYQRADFQSGSRVLKKVF